LLVSRKGSTYTDSVVIGIKIAKFQKQSTTESYNVSQLSVSVSVPVSVTCSSTGLRHCSNRNHVV